MIIQGILLEAPIWYFETRIANKHCLALICSILPWNIIPKACYSLWSDLLSTKYTLDYSFFTKLLEPNMYPGNTNDVHRQKFGNNWMKKDYIKETSKCTSYSQ